MCDIFKLEMELIIKGQSLLGVLKRDNKWVVYKHDPKLAGRKPRRNECRDALDYKLMKTQWEKMGTVVMYVDKNFDQAVRGAIEVLQKGS